MSAPDRAAGHQVGTAAHDACHPGRVLSLEYVWHRLSPRLSQP